MPDMSGAVEVRGQTWLPKSAANPARLKLEHPSYQPSKAELEDPIEFLAGTTPDDLASALTEMVEVRYARLQRKKR